MAGILSKGITLSYSTTSGGTYTEIAGLQSCPQLGGSPDKVETTTLANGNRTYINGIKDLGDLEFKFLYDNSEATSNFRVLKGLETAGDTLYWKVEFPDPLTSGTGTHHGTQFSFSGQVALSVEAQEVNSALTFLATITVASDIEVTDPA